MNQQHTFEYWVGLDTHPMTIAETKQFNEFYDRIHAREVLAFNPGFSRVTRFELDARREPVPGAPRWLARYAISDEASAQAYLRRDEGPPQKLPMYTAGGRVWETKRIIVWRIVWEVRGELASYQDPVGDISIQFDNRTGAESQDSREQQLQVVRVLTAAWDPFPSSCRVTSAGATKLETGGRSGRPTVHYRRLA